MRPDMYPDVPASMTPRARREWQRRYEETVSRRDFVVALHDWLATVPWEWFGHLTVDTCKGIRQMRKLVAYWRADVNRRIFRRGYWRHPNLGLRVFHVVERQHRGDFHAHVLVTGTAGADPKVGAEVWNVGARRYPNESVVPVRNALVERFDPGRGGIGYLVNHLDARDPDILWDLVGPPF